VNDRIWLVLVYLCINVAFAWAQSSSDEHGNYPLHYEASIPVEKMPLLDGSNVCCYGVNYNERMGVLRMLLDISPEVTRHRNMDGDFPLLYHDAEWSTMGHYFCFCSSVLQYPQALQWAKDIPSNLVPRILEK